MRFRGIARTATVAALCATVAGAAGIAGSSAASKTKTHKTTNSSTTQAGRPMGRPGGMAVHADEVVLNKAGTAYITQSEDNGTVVSATSDTLVITEGTTALPYKTVTLTIPSGATIDRDGATAALTAFVAGDHVQVTQSSDGTTVFGGDKTDGPGAGGFGGHGPGGPGGPGGHGGPPPGAAAGSAASSSSSSSGS
jgi:hypothetical protein